MRRGEGVGRRRAGRAMGRMGRAAIVGWRCVAKRRARGWDRSLGARRQRRSGKGFEGAGGGACEASRRRLGSVGRRGGRRGARRLEPLLRAERDGRGDVGRCKKGDESAKAAPEVRWDRMEISRRRRRGRDQTNEAD